MGIKLKPFLKGLGFLFLVLLIAGAPLTFAKADDTDHQDENEIQGHFTDEFLALVDNALTHNGGNRPSRTRNLSVVSHLSFNESASNTTNTDVWALGNFAYVGTFSSPACAGDLGLGVKIIDISDPSNPQWIGDLASPRERARMM